MNFFTPKARRSFSLCIVIMLWAFGPARLTAQQQQNNSEQTLICGICFASYPFDYGDGTQEGCCIQDPGFPGTCTVYLCQGQTLYVQPNALTNPTTAVQISWDFGGGAPNPAPVNYPSPGVFVAGTAGTFTFGFTAIYPTGPPITCQVAFNVVVSPAPVPAFTISPNPACVGQDLCLDITSPAGSYTSFSFTNLQGVNYPCSAPPAGSCDDCMSFAQPGTYDIQLTLDNNGCQASTVQQVVVNPVVPAFTWQANCTNTVAFTNTTQCGSANLTYDWTVNGSPITSGYPGFSYTFPGAGTYTVTLDVSFNGNPEGSVTNIVTVGASMTLQTFISNPSCAHACNGVASVVPSGGTAPYSWAWSSGQTSPAIVGCGGTYTCVVTDAAGCSATTTVVLHDPPQLTATISGTNPCFHTCNGSVSVTPSGGTPPYTYQWSNGQTTQNIINLCPGSYSCTVTDANGCIVNVSTILLPQPVVPSNIVTTAGPGPFCTTDPSFNILGTPANDAIFTGTFSSSTGSPFTNAFTNSFSFNPATAGAGTHTYSFTVTNANGCSHISTLTFVVQAPPQILFSSFADVCVNSGNINLISYVFPIGGTFSGNGVIAGHFFSPQVAGVGTHTITYTYTSGACTATATATITVTPEVWQQTSSSTTSLDIGRDVTTDPSGNIYVTGDIGGPTTFGAGSNMITVPGRGMFVAKYDECGTLLWVAYTLNGASTGRGISVDPINNAVYVVGDIRNISTGETFVDAMVNPNVLTPCSNPSLGVSGVFSSYLAKYDATDGCLLNVAGYGNQVNNIISLQAVDEEGGFVYACGRRTNALNVNESIAGKADPLTLAPIWNAVSSAGTPGNSCIAMDIAVRGTDVYITGTFQNKMTLGTVTLLSAAGQDAYVFRLKDLGAAWSTTWGQKGGAVAGQKSGGQSIAINPSGIPFVTGSYTGTLSPAFGGGALTGPNNVNSAYVCRLNPATGASTWQRSVQSMDVTGTGIAADANSVYVTGNFLSTATITFTSGPPLAANTGPWGKIFDMQLNPANGITTWRNISQTLIPSPINLQRSEGNAIGANGFVYTTGHYQGVMDLPPYLPAPQGMLTSTGAGPNMFLIRENANNGNYQRLANDSVNNTPEGVSGFDVIPNPNNGQFSIVLDDQSYSGEFTLEVFDMLGNSVFSGHSEGAAKMDVDLGTSAAGLYLVRVTKGTDVIQKKILVTQ